MLIGPQNLAENARFVRLRIASAATAAGRAPASVTLVAVTKGHDAETLRTAARCGLDHIGESYVQEALPKLAALAGEGAITWHFVGRLQANKTRVIAERFAWVHAVDRVKIAERLSAQRPFHAPPLNICLEVNLEGEYSKAGVEPGGLVAVARAVAALPRLRLRGLMCIPPPVSDPTLQRSRFARLRALLADLRSAGVEGDALSMGMSDDYELAIAEGATHVRVGTALFGPRP
ncbi:MAG TPA: YggS family pyridoxal phosphate-dependent enzyme [Steroidobacteraceae bacterium]|nr:YggS family pyridoxal phosphate-dependent enzyme [Steroidobacteraceae bacterium]